MEQTDEYIVRPLSRKEFKLLSDEEKLIRIRTQKKLAQRVYSKTSAYSEYGKNWRQNNKGNIFKTNNEYRENNKEQLKQYFKDYYQKNKDSYKARYSKQQQGTTV